MNDCTLPPPRRRKLTPAELYFPPEIVKAVRADQAVHVRRALPTILDGGCELYRLAPSKCGLRLPKGQSGDARRLRPIIARCKSVASTLD